VRSRASDAAPVRRGRDQDPEPGQLVCKLAQGQTGEWAGTDCDGRTLMITRAGDGTLEIRHAGNGEEDPDTIAQQAPLARDANAPGELTAGKAFEARMSAALAPGRDADQNTPCSLRGLQALLTSHYRRR
jgi:hypothetical protein